MLRHERSGAGLLSPTPSPPDSSRLSPEPTLRPAAGLIWGTIAANVASSLLLAIILVCVLLGQRFENIIGKVFEDLGLFVPLVLPAVIVTESLVLRLRLRIGWSVALQVATIAKLVSVFVAVAAGWPYPNTDGWLPAFRGLVLLFLSFCAVEYLVARWMLSPKRPGAVAGSPKPARALRPTASLLRSMFNANVASYLFLAMSLVALWATGNLRPTPRPYQAYAVGSVRTINTAEITYSSTYDKGFSPSLAALAPLANGGANPTAEAAGLIDSVLASGEKDGYRFTYRPAPPDATGKITSYTLVASPLNANYGPHKYFTDQSGVIRETTEDRDATASDPPIAG